MQKRESQEMDQGYAVEFCSADTRFPTTRGGPTSSGLVNADEVMPADGFMENGCPTAFSADTLKLLHMPPLGKRSFSMRRALLSGGPISIAKKKPKVETEVKPPNFLRMAYDQYHQDMHLSSAGFSLEDRVTSLLAQMNHKEPVSQVPVLAVEGNILLALVLFIHC